MSFWKCGAVCVCVCLCDPIGLHDKSVFFYLISVGFEIVAATVCFFVLQRPNFDSEAIMIPKIYARLQEIASNFSKFSGGGPQTPRRRSHLRRSVRSFAAYRAPLSKIRVSAPVMGHIFATFLPFEAVNQGNSLELPDSYLVWEYRNGWATGGR